MSAADEVELSDYEKLRLKHIQRNEKRLQDLGLGQKVLKVIKKKRHTIATPSLSPQQPTRRSTRKRKLLNYKEDQSNHKIIEHEENATSAHIVSDNSDIEENEEEEFQPLEDVFDDEQEVVDSTAARKRSKTHKKTEEVKVIKHEPSKTASSSIGGLKCEFAKTGRATCRKCRTTIEKGSPRVGMQAWIVGRQALTWQKTECFLSNFTCAYDVSGRTRCKITGESFTKGELKIGARSHSATSYYKMEAFKKMLEHVLPWATSQESVRTILTVENVDGQEILTKEDRTKLQSIMKNALSAVTSQIPNEAKLETKPMEDANEKTPKKQTKIVKSEDKISTQPKLGKKLGATGRVEWKFGGHLCYGTLLPNSETKTHCYARTRKGNTKTLAKGKDYWCILD